MPDIKPRRRFGGKKSLEGASVKPEEPTSGLVKKRKPKTVGRIMNQIPEDILNNEDLNNSIKLLPSNYNFEIHKTVWNIKKQNAKRVALQMPEGLLIYSLIIADILEQFCDCEILVMGDVSYGACCIDDYTARSLDCDFIVHYAHSCLVPIDITAIKVLYVFVTITIDEKHLESTIRRNFEHGTRLAVFGTIQFNPAIHALKGKLLEQKYDTGNECDSKIIYAIPPQTMPLSKGEVLGCTSARLNKEQYDGMIYVGDGRFHLESAMIHNPEIPAYRYDPYSRKFTREYYDQQEMNRVREDAINVAARAKTIGLILGALGRQGSPQTLATLEEKLKAKGLTVVKIILSEIFPLKLAMFDGIDAFVQVACPRLSIDWGYAFSRPLLTPYECMVMLEQDKMWKSNYYPMDYYHKDGYGRGKVPDHSDL
ncbi:Diphthamide biosynthesis protein 1 [Komagataella phaffii CBS 7435]|uniref:2-(3-amino-3-carboxypropyl)histidine synthase subunit 1 n=2 Tax=Komagataella phaffii TaxID=460519 RepID=C4R6S2_KOMPG|nr:Protein required, along with Dph2p, Kti11p, Jjj3p, and Dph5p, for synthesis of diphthamide [Komagataella phaffii GS115]AOA65049.1 GQ67_04378T0 [Komagataella phaffii]CAH2451359.1 Diphthamide biosynthesis protein 1 [Komagataella phaffii CBS 7435]AOA69895.1 GQ68_04350T0 [Komagataella phaffii GS115]CAY71297.1 Protein required, along with Dph2p, Kti11p, Jjj3p, and Dph5p, for synthesis of diphthamide [Komagataella phaffii GS115]CCA41095.1 Diphthamide biosynthesis protein 1 [Komagataella phaffii C